MIQVRQPVTYEWDNPVKLNLYCSYPKYKSRLIAKHFDLRKGIEYGKTYMYSPNNVRLGSIRFIQIRPINVGCLLSKISRENPSIEDTGRFGCS